MKIEAFTIKVPKRLVKGRIEPGTRHGSRPHKDKSKYTAG